MDYAKAAPATIFNHLFTPDMLDEWMPISGTVRSSSGYLVDRIAEIQKTDPAALKMLMAVRDKYATLEGREGIESNAVEAAIQRGLEKLTKSPWMEHKKGCVAKLAYLLDPSTDLKREQREFWKSHFVRAAKIIGVTSAVVAGFAAIQFATPELQSFAPTMLDEANKMALISAGAVSLAPVAYTRPVQALLETAEKVDAKTSLMDFFSAAPQIVYAAKAAVQLAADDIGHRLSLRRTPSAAVAELSRAWTTDRLQREPMEVTRDRVAGLLERHVAAVGYPQDLDALGLARAQKVYKELGSWVESTGDRDLQSHFERLIHQSSSTSPRLSP